MNTHNEKDLLHALQLVCKTVAPHFQKLGVKKAFTELSVLAQAQTTIHKATQEHDEPKNGKTKPYNYHRDQLDKINTRSEYAPTFQFRGDTDKTKWMDLNEHSAKILVQWLKDNYLEPQGTEGQDRENYTDEQDRKTI